jgi:hypothetical protein
MPVTYRRARGSDTWHFREDCAHWPEADFDQQSRAPVSGVCCMECTYWSPASPRERIGAPKSLLSNQG